MKQVRRLAVIILAFATGIIVGQFGVQVGVLVLCPVMLLWWMIFDFATYSKQVEVRRNELRNR